MLELLNSELELPDSLDDEISVELLYLCRTSSLSGNGISELSVQDKRRIRASPRQNAVLLLKYIDEG